jgi:hypothetical protein
MDLLINYFYNNTNLTIYTKGEKKMDYSLEIEIDL